METSTESTQMRPPLAIMLVTGLAFTWWLYLVVINLAVRWLNISAAPLPINIPGIHGGGTIFQAIFLAQIWQMKLWGVFAYGGFILFEYGVYYITGDLVWWWLIVPGLVGIVGGLYYKRMH